MHITAVPDAAELRDHWWWRPGWRPGVRMLSWVLTFEGEESLHGLAEQVQKAVAPIPALQPVPVPWLHLTLTTVAEVVDVSDDGILRAINAAHAHIAGQERLVLHVAGIAVFAESVVLEPEPSLELTRLRQALVDSAAGVRGAVSAGDFVPHLSVAYANGPASGADVVAALADADLRGGGPVHPTLSLVEMTRDERQYTWRPVSAFPL